MVEESWVALWDALWDARWFRARAVADWEAAEEPEDSKVSSFDRRPVVEAASFMSAVEADSAMLRDCRYASVALFEAAEVGKGMDDLRGNERDNMMILQKSADVCYLKVLFSGRLNRLVLVRKGRLPTALVKPRRYYTI